MEFGLREYLLILGAILILGLLIDGIRRTLNHRRQGLKLDLMAVPPDSPESAQCGAPRPAKRLTAEQLEPEAELDPLMQSGETGQLNLWAGDLRAEHMKSIDPERLKGPSVDRVSGEAPSRKRSAPMAPGQRMEPVFDVSDDLIDPVVDGQAAASIDALTDPIDSPEPIKPSADLPLPTASALTDPDLDGQPVEASAAQMSAPPEAEPTGHQDSIDAVDATDPAIGDEHHLGILADGPNRSPMELASDDGLFASTVGRLWQYASTRVKGAASSDPSPAMARVAPREASVETAPASVPPAPPVSTPRGLVVIQIKPARADRFQGVNLHTACLRAGLRRSEVGVYQRIPLDQDREPLFSLVNCLEPGSFDEDARAIDSPGFFLLTQLELQADPVFSLNELISGARSIAREIGGEVFDQDQVLLSKEWLDQTRALAQRFARTGA